MLQGEDFSGNAYCAAEESITAGGVDPEFVPIDGQGPGVTVGDTGHVVFSAPIVELVPPFSVAKGGLFSVGANLAGPCDFQGFNPVGHIAQKDTGLITYWALSSDEQPFDRLLIQLYAPSTGSFALTGENYAYCEECVTFSVGCTDSGCDKTFLASQGTLEVSSTDVFFTGSLTNLELIEVTFDEITSTPVPDGATYCISSWNFSVPFNQ